MSVETPRTPSRSVSPEPHTEAKPNISYQPRTAIGRKVDRYQRLSEEALARTEKLQDLAVAFDLAVNKWESSSYRERLALRSQVRQFCPKGSVGRKILEELGSACSTCAERRPVLREQARLWAVKRYPARAVPLQGAYGAPEESEEAKAEAQDAEIGAFFAKYVSRTDR